MTPGADGALAVVAGQGAAPAPEVAVLRWPAEADLRDELAGSRAPRLLLVDADVPPPECDDPLEDWVRLPASDADLDARRAVLARRAASTAAVRPAIDPDGVVRLGDAWVALPPVEARLMTALISRLGAVVHRDDLAAAGWPEGLPGRNALDVHVLRLRRRLAPLGLVIRTIRARGYLVEVAPEATGGSSTPQRERPGRRNTADTERTETRNRRHTAGK